MKIGVYGSSSGSMGTQAMETARELGRNIARRGHTVITGGCAGIPHEAVLGAKEIGGKAIAYSSASSKALHVEGKMPTEGFTDYVFVPVDFASASDVRVTRKYRNLSSVTACDAAIFLCGQFGTLNEFTIAYDLLRPCGVVLGTGGVADLLPELTRKIQKEPKPFMVFSSDLDYILDALEKAQK